MCLHCTVHSRRHALHLLGVAELHQRLHAALTYGRLEPGRPWGLVVRALWLELLRRAL